MQLSGRQIALYGRFRSRPRAEIAAAAAAAGGRIAQDLTRATDLMVVGEGATNFVANGHLGQRLAAARARGAAVMAEARFLAALAGEAAPASTLSTTEIGVYLPEAIIDLLNAFGLIQFEDGAVRFADAAVLRSAASLLAEDPAPLALLKTLLAHREAPAGRHKLVTGADGAPLLAWEDGLTTLDGQGLLDLDDAPPLDELFEAAMMAEAEGDLEVAERLYDTCGRGDRRDPIAPFNRANVLMRLGDDAQAALAYRQALDRDPTLAEAHYNLASALERQGEAVGAASHLEAALAIEPAYPDALFNLGQLRLQADAREEAARLFQRFLETSPSPYWERKARAGLAVARDEAG